MLQFKNISDSVLDVDDKTRTVKVAVSEVGSKDLDNDIIDNSAYTKTVSERGPGAQNLIWHLTDHNPSLKSAIGKPSNIVMEGNKLTFTTNIAKTDWGNDVLEMYKNGMINQHSVGFKSVKSELMNKGEAEEYTLIKEIKLFEGSAVLWGANPNTPTMTVGKSEMKQEVDVIDRELDILSKCLKNGRFTDDTFELVELRIINLKDRIRNLFLTVTTPAEAKASLEPVKEKEFVKSLQALIFLNRLK
jgi:HK97 family phage prohead protease